MHGLENHKALHYNQEIAIPRALIYEMSKGETLYYKGYKDYLRGNKSIEELMGSSYLQVFLIIEIIKRLLKELPDSYQVFTNELGVIHEQGSWRLLDIAVYLKENLKDVPLDNKYLTIPPEVAIEIDTKADLDKFFSAMDYVYGKTDDLLKFGVKKVIWIFTNSKKIMIASTGKQWITVNWSEPISVIEDIVINLEEMVKGKI
jgi:Uma2 family endonuclease